MIAPRRTLSVVLLSGGLDSAANLAFCREADEPVLALTADYGQRAFEPELRAAQAFCDYYGVPHARVDLRWLGQLGGSSLTSAAQEVPKLLTSLLDDRSTTEASARAVWVPNRNGVLINVAAAYAERLAATRVVVGFNVEEAVTFPDNSEEFLQRTTSSLEYSTANGVRVYCYTTQWNKRQIVAELRKLKTSFPFDRVWSCYLGGSHPCQECESCLRFARAQASGELA
ncbi:7-cyano-7-deazaguanine synthase QueC [Bdellovibrionota bacterium FG-1]